ncbi:Phosphatidylinositolglycan class N-domain-containing protein [Lipomyces arxii]|uniref:Phosphatidylinositolglycan class N-domain-containing protein n=1 Tax=Lipomyces arxii TaxID=56418 RepID=UPI0034CDC32E
MNRLGKQAVLLIGIVFHLVYLWSIFDIYFITPLVHGMQHFLSTDEAPAKRLFLVVGDGLRADKCLEPKFNDELGSYEYAAPFIRSKILNEGTFGVSHTRMPTESRPGHVAIIAGFYEDVSAVTKGWKENPVNFDSVFNQSRHTWSFGSPDILPMFALGASDPDRVDTYMYGHDFEDFTMDTRDLDTFVFDHVEELFKSASTDPKINVALRQDKIVFFLHCLGIDTAGHASRPYSQQYYDNIRHVDAGIKKLEKMVNEFYNDDKTAWVFTADHGMSDWGSHGDGHPDNTRTPLVAWGAGVAKPDKLNPTGHDNFSIPWDLPVKRVDVEQADIASLMTYLVGLNYPANSVGRIPLDFIDASLSVKSKAVVANAQAILEQYKVKETQIAATELKFKPYSMLENSTTDLDQLTASLLKFDVTGDYFKAIDLAHELIGLGLRGLRYLQTYNWLFLRSIVTLGFVGWILYALASFLDYFILPSKIKPSLGLYFSSVAIVILGVIFSIFYTQHSSVLHYLYAVFPVFFWESVLEYRASLIEGMKILIWKTHNKAANNSMVKVLIEVVLFFVFMEAMVAGYFHREVFSVIFGLISIWPILQNYAVSKKNKMLVFGWFVSCWLMSTFTLLPVIKVESPFQIISAGIMMTLIGVAGMIWLAKRSAAGGHEVSQLNMIVLGLQLGLVILSMPVTYSTIQSLKKGNGLPFGNQVVGWLVVVCSFVVPMLHLKNKYHDYRTRLLILFLAFAPSFVILTISYEGLFYVTFFVNLVLWVDVEHKIYDDRMKSSAVEQKTSSSEKNGHHGKPKVYRRLELEDVRIALFCFFLTQIAFFGTGNIASISSFSLDSVYRLLPIFDPFLMGALLIYKILIPFAVISADLGLLTQRLGVQPSSIFTMVLSISDILTLNFFYLVLDEGSWLDIGMSISHYCIASLLCLFVIMLEYLSEALVSGVTIEA